MNFYRLESAVAFVHPRGMVRFIRDINAEKMASGRPVISFEFFPFKTDEGERNFFEKTLPTLNTLRPDFCSVTYGAGGSTRDKTLTIVDRIQRDFGLTTMAHLTCVNSTQEELRAVVEQARSLGIKNLLALRGDPPGGGEFQKTNGGFEYSFELVRFLRELGGFSIGTAGFPEGHIACKEGKQVDWQRLKSKVDCGADFVITQLFFDNRDYFEFRDHLRGLGVTAPIHAGIIAIQSAAQIKKFSALCGAKLPERLLARLEALGADDAAATEFGIEYATEQCQELLRAGEKRLHFYTLNKAHSTVRILQNLGLT